VAADIETRLHVEVGTVPGYGSDIKVCRHPDGSAAIWVGFGGASVSVPPESVGPLGELLNRSAVPGQLTPEATPVPVCVHCGGEIAPCLGGALPVCKGWIHVAYAERHPVGAHYCEARSVNPSAEPATA